VRTSGADGPSRSGSAGSPLGSNDGWGMGGHDPVEHPEQVSTRRHVSAPSQCKLTAKPIPHTSRVLVCVQAQQDFSLPHEMARSHVCIGLQYGRCTPLHRVRIGLRSGDKIPASAG
jgi:hypothetical protein